MILKLLSKTLNDFFNLQDFKDDFTTVDNAVTAIENKITAINQQTFNIEQFRTGNITDTQLLNNALSAIPKNSVLKFDSNKTYTLQSIPKITKAITLDFNGADVIPNTTGDLFTVGFSGELEGRIKFIGFNIVKNATVIPNTLFKIDDGINTEIIGKFSGVKVAHSLIWNYKGYGTKIRGEMRRVDSPRCIYLSNNGLDVHSYAFDINIDITGNTGLGIEMEGGNGSVRGVIESCSTGFKYNAISVISSLNIKVYFENNTDQDMLFQDASGSQATVFLNSSFFTRANLTSKKAIVLGRRIFITSIGNFFNHAGIYETEIGVSAASTYNGINNAFISGGNSDFSVNGSEISDGIFNTISKSISSGNNTTQLQYTAKSNVTKAQYRAHAILSDGAYSIYSNGGADAIMFDGGGKTVYGTGPTGSYSLGTSANNFKDIWINNVMYLGVFSSTNRPTPTRGGAMIYDVTVKKPLWFYSGVWYDAMGNAV